MKLPQTALLCLFLVQAAFCQEKLGTVQFKAIPGWTRTAAPNVVGFSEVNPSTGAFCIITLYGATPGTGSPQGDYAREYESLAVRPLQASASSAPATQTVEGGTVTAGGGVAEVQGKKASVFLTVISRGTTTVSVLGVLSDPSYLASYTGFLDGLDMDRQEVPTASGEALNAITLVREFDTNEVRANASYRGKRLRIHGFVNKVEVGRDGNYILTFKSGMASYGMARCYFPRSQAGRLGALTPNQDAVVEGTVRGLDRVYGTFLNFDDCVVP